MSFINYFAEAAEEAEERLKKAKKEHLEAEKKYLEDNLYAISIAESPQQKAKYLKKYGDESSINAKIAKIDTQIAELEIKKSLMRK